MKKTILIPVTIVNYPWLNICLKSIKDNLIGYDEIVIVGCNNLDTTIDGIKICENADKIDREYLIQSYIVTHADTFVNKETDVVIIILPNFVICRKFNLDKLIIDGKPTILCDTYASLSRQTGDIYKTVQNWQSSTEQILGINSIDLEFARTMPIAYPYFVFAELRDFLKKRLCVSTMVDYFNEVDNEEVPEGFCFSEFNVIGAYLYEEHNEAVNWIIMSKSDNLSKVLPVGTVGIFEPIFDDSETVILLENESEKKENYDTITRKYLKKLSKMRLTKNAFSVY